MAILSKIIKGNNLSLEQDWIKHIESLKVSDNFGDKGEAIKSINETLEIAIKKRMPKKHFGVMFSGGIDSTLIAFLIKRLKGDFTCYTVGIEDARDIIESQKIAKLLGFNQKIKILGAIEVENYIKETFRIIKDDSVVNAGVGATALAAIRLGKEDGVASFFSGLGSEEIFAGYERHSKAKNINEECWSGLKGMWKKDLGRDYAIGTHENVDLLVPFLDEELIKAAMKVPGEWKITFEEKKMILREAAIALGMPKAIAMRKKIAAQYGSGIDHVFEKLAKRHGMGKKEYLRSLS